MRLRRDDGFTLGAALSEALISFLVRMAFLLADLKDKDQVKCHPNYYTCEQQ